jgi:hypothetical protein
MTSSRVLFGGAAVAAGVRLERPRYREVRGAVVLPGIGGEASVRDGPSVLAGLVRFGHASSRVIGEQDAGGVDMPGVRRADRLAAELSSTSGPDHAFHEDSLTVEGLRVDGHPYQVNAELLRAIRTGPTLDRLREVVGRDPVAARAVSETGPGELVCSLVEARAQGAARRFAMDSTMVQVSLGEYAIGERQRRLTMVRVELEPVAGQSPAAEARQGAILFLELAIDARP